MQQQQQSEPKLAREGLATGIKGRVRFFNKEKGWGFIRRADTNGDVFVHFKQILRQEGYRKLEDGQMVVFDVDFDEARQKPIATNVVVVSE